MITCVLYTFGVACAADGSGVCGTTGTSLGGVVDNISSLTPVEPLHPTIGISSFVGDMPRHWIKIGYYLD